MSAWQGPWVQQPEKYRHENYRELKAAQSVEHLAWTIWHTNRYIVHVLLMEPIDPISLFLPITQRKRE